VLFVLLLPLLLLLLLCRYCCCRTHAGLPGLLAVPPSSTLTSLAAAHPATYCGLVERCVRSQHFEALDICVEADVLMHAGMVLHGPPAEWLALLGNPAAVKAQLSAVTTVVKQAAVMTKAAGSAHGEARQPAAGAADAKTAVAAGCFPAVVPALVRVLLASMAGGLSCLLPDLGVHEVVVRTHADTASSSSSSSSSREAVQQCRANAALLTVLVARSPVVLADEWTQQQWQQAAVQHNCLQGEVTASTALLSYVH
jgi:hypothetical protein